MTNERKVELYNELLGYICILISDEKELIRTLIRLGFTEEELMEEGLIEDGGK